VACGALRYADAAAGELCSLGMRATRSGGSRFAAGRGLQALSEREREIAERVAQGLTNREIVERLFLKEKTVQGHLTRIFAKLDIGSRAALAAAVERARTAERLP
jgi:DNA-binding CsgD family transcriptional regulator